MTNYKIEGAFKLLSPLSHIGETISVSSYLVQERIIQDDMTVADVFVYSGNAWRGQLRDLAARYMLDKLGGEAGPAQVGQEMFALLFSGGRIGGTQTTDIGQARRMRAMIPHIAIFGGGVGNQILQGKLRVGNCYPVCREATPVLSNRWQSMAEKIEYTDLTMTKEHSRRDDSKIENIHTYMRDPVAGLLGFDEPSEGKKKPERDGPADQMRMRMELLNAGTRLQTWLSLDAASELELGCLVSALHLWADAPHIGGQSSRGYGLADLDYRIIDRRTGAVVEEFVKVTEGACLLSPTAENAKERYDQHLRSIYDQALANNAAGITAFLEGAA